MYRSLVLSFLIHAFIFILIFDPLISNSKNQKVSPIVLEAIYYSETRGGAGEENLAQSPRSTIEPKFVPLKNLVPKYSSSMGFNQASGKEDDFSTKDNGSSESNFSSKDDGKSVTDFSSKGDGGSATDFGRKMGLGSSARLYPSLLWLHQKIDERLHYPDELVAYRRLGRVSIEFQLQKNGTAELEELLINTTDHVLKVYVIWILEEALKEPLPEQKQLEKSIPVKLVFDFEIKSPGVHDLPFEKVVNNELHFRRSVVNTLPVGMWQEISDRNVITGVGIDVFSIFNRFLETQKRKKWKKISYDPLEKYKRDKRY